MRGFEPTDPALALNRRAQAEHWPYRFDNTLSFAHHELNTLHDIWRSLAAGRPAPSRADFNARTLKPFLRNILILERIFVDTAKWRYRYRLIGTAIAEMFGENTGRFMDEHIPPKLLPRFMGTCDAILDTGAPLRFVGNVEFQDLAYLQEETFAAPLADANGAITLVFACVHFTPTCSGGEA